MWATGGFDVRLEEVVLGLRRGRGATRGRISGRGVDSESIGVLGVSVRKVSRGREGLWSVCTTYGEELRNETGSVYIEPL